MSRATNHHVEGRRHRVAPIAHPVEGPGAETGDSVATRAATVRTTALRIGLAATVAAALAGCSDGQLVDAGGERGGGGLAFVLLVLFVALFTASLFYMDHVRKRRSGNDE